MSAANNQQPTTPPGRAPEVDPSGSPIPAAEVARRAAFEGVLRARDSAYARKFRVLRITPAEEEVEGEWVCPSLPAAYHMLRDDKDIGEHVRVVKYEVPAHTGKAVALHWLILLLEEVPQVEKVEVLFGVETAE